MNYLRIHKIPPLFIKCDHNIEFPLLGCFFHFWYLTLQFNPKKSPQNSPSLSSALHFCYASCGIETSLHICCGARPAEPVSSQFLEFCRNSYLPWLTRAACLNTSRGIRLSVRGVLWLQLAGCQYYNTYKWRTNKNITLILHLLTMHPKKTVRNLRE